MFWGMVLTLWLVAVVSQCPLCENLVRIKIVQKVAIPHRPTALSIIQIELVVGQFVTAPKNYPSLSPKDE